MMELSDMPAVLRTMAGAIDMHMALVRHSVATAFAKLSESSNPSNFHSIEVVISQHADGTRRNEQYRWQDGKAIYSADSLAALVMLVESERRDRDCPEEEE